MIITRMKKFYDTKILVGPGAYLVPARKITSWAHSVHTAQEVILHARTTSASRPDSKLQNTFYTESISASLNTVAEPLRTKYSGETELHWLLVKTKVWLEITEYLFYESPASHSLDMHCPCVYILPYPLIENIEKILPQLISIYSLKSYFPSVIDLCIPAWLKITEHLLHRMHLRLTQYSCRTSAYEVQRRTINVLNPALKQIRFPIIKNSDEFQGLRNEANNDKPLALGAISRWKETDLSQTHVGKERSEVRGKDAMMS